MLLTIICPRKKISWKRKKPASVPKIKPCGILLVGFKREILREWLGSEKTLSFEAQNTKIFWWIRGSNNTSHCRGCQRKSWLCKKKRCYWKTWINTLCKAWNPLSKSLILGLEAWKMKELWPFKNSHIT